MKTETRQASLCLFRREDCFLVAEIVDPLSGAVLHRPPGGGMEEGESPEETVRREVLEELGIALSCVEPLGKIDHTWHWKDREIHERAWLFLAAAADDARLSRGETIELIEADGQRFRTLWRSIGEEAEASPPTCPGTLLELLRPVLNNSLR